MLILVGVTISVALNGGLFKTAQDATTNTLIGAEKEQLLSAVVVAYETEAGAISKSKLETNLGAGWKVEGTNGGPYTVTSPKGNKFTVETNGTIEYIGKEEKDNTNPSELTDLQKYILGADGKGRNVNDILDLNNALTVPNMKFLPDPADSNSKIHEDLKFVNFTFTGDSFDFIEIQMRYNRDIYKFLISTDNMETGNLTNPTTPERNLGKYVEYKENKWIVLYDDEEKVELISANALGKATLGYEDEGAKANVPVADENNLTDEEKFKRAAWSYNNAIKTLTKTCKDVTGITTENIRNICGPVEDPTDLANATLEEVKSIGFTPDENLDEETLTKLKTNIESLKKGDQNYLDDYKQMETLGILIPDIPEDYWFASRNIERSQTDGSASFTLNYCYCSGDLLKIKCNKYSLCQVGTGTLYLLDGRNTSMAVRPVVTLSPGILDNKEGEGTRANPIKLK